MAIEKFSNAYVFALLNEAMKNKDYRRVEAFLKFYKLFKALITSGFEDYPLDEYLDDYGEAGDRGELDDLERAIISSLKSASTEGGERLVKAKELFLALEEYLANMDVGEMPETVTPEDSGVSSPIEITDEARRFVRIGTETIIFPPAAFKVFSVLLAHAGDVVSHKELNRILDIPENKEAPLSNTIGGIRIALKKQLGPDFPAELLVQNERGKGYRLNLGALNREG